MELNQVTGAAGTGLFNIYSSSGGLTYFSLQHLGYANSNAPIGEFVRLRLTCNGQSATLTNIDDPTKTRTFTWETGTVNRLRWVISDTSSTEFRFKNIRIYPI